MNEKPAKKTNHGGAGRNQGRKPEGEEVLDASIVFRATEAQKAKAGRLGKGNAGAWLRKAIDKAKE